MRSSKKQNGWQTNYLRVQKEVNQCLSQGLEVIKGIVVETVQNIAKAFVLLLHVWFTPNQLELKDEMFFNHRRISTTSYRDKEAANLCERLGGDIVKVMHLVGFRRLVSASLILTC
jgi:hypothetical protein